MYGKEKTSKRQPKGGDATLEYQFFFVNLQLRHPDWEREIRQGVTYVMPFTIRLPTSLPSSDSFLEDSSVGSYRIQYKLRARVAGKAKKETYLRIQSQPLPDERVPCIIQPTNYALSSLRLVNRGRILLAARVEDTHVGRGEHIALHLACHNDSTAELQRVKISLVEELYWTATSTSAARLHRSRTLFCLRDVTVPGLDKSVKTREHVRSLTANQEESFHQLYTELMSGRNKVLIKLPTQMRDTYRGRIVKVIHHLVIDMKTEKTVTNPSVSIPLRIGEPAVRSSGPPLPVVLPAAPPVQRHYNPTGATAAAIPSAPSQALASVPPLEATAIPSAPPEALVFAPPLEVSLATMEEPDIPIVEAIAIPADAAFSNVVDATDNVMYLGDDAVLVVSDHDNNDHFEANFSGRAPLSALEHSPVSLDTLRREMMASINDYDIILRHLQDSAWRQLLDNLSPDNFGSLLACVNVDFDQPRVAYLLASGRPNLTCEHVAAAVRNTAEWNRTGMVKKLLPRCADVIRNDFLIRNELNDWERTVCEVDFARARETGVVPAWYP
eukprot:scaffold5237_cov179-Amphora_coffeaeformis.AAC.18